MIHLPIVGRELRALARRPGTHWTRWGVAVVAIAVWAVLALGSQRAVSPREMGHNLFLAVTIPGFGFCLLAGVFLTADCLSSERREGTLGLLFLTNLRGYDVVLGKLAATSLHALYALLAILPAMALPLLMGGVTGGEFWRMALMLVTTLLLSLALGMAVSAVVREIRNALAATLGLVAAVAGLPVLLLWLFRVFSSVPAYGGLVLLPSPGFAYWAALDMNYQHTGMSVAAGVSTARGFWISLALFAGLALGLLAWASFILPGRWQETGGATPRRVAQNVGGGPGDCDPRQDRLWDRRRLEANPFHWLVQRDDRTGRLAAWLTWMGVLLWLPFFIGMFRRNHHNDESFLVSLCIAFVLHAILKCLCAAEASRRFSEDRASGALELMLATPVSPAAILRGQWQTLQNHFAVPRFLLLLINLAYIYATVLPDPMQIRSEADIFVAMYIGGSVMLWMDSYALGWVGMRLGLSGRKHHRAVLAALGQVMVPMWVLLFVWVMLCAFNIIGDGNTVRGMTYVWFTLGLALDWFLGRHACRTVTTHFRELAAMGPRSATPRT